MAGGHGRVHKRDVTSVHSARLQLFDQRFVGPERTCNHHQTGGVLVQAVHDTGARQPGQIGIVMQQGVLQRTIRVAGRRMHHQSGRLVDDQQLAVRVAHIERDGLRLNVRLFEQSRVNLDAFAAAHPLLRRGRAVVDLHASQLYPLLQAAARVAAKQLGKHHVQTPTGSGERYLRSEVNALRHRCGWPTASRGPYNLGLTSVTGHGCRWVVYASLC